MRRMRRIVTNKLFFGGFCRLCVRLNCFSVTFTAFLLWVAVMQPTAAFDMSSIHTLRLGDEVTSDMLEQLTSLREILSQPLSLGFFIKGGAGPPGSAGAAGEAGERGLMGDSGHVGEDGSTGHEGTIGPPGQPGPAGRPGINAASDIANISKHYDDYGRRPLTASEKSHVVCEGDRLWLQCMNYENIKINDAFWGRDDFFTCPQPYPGNSTVRQYSLDADRVLLKVKEDCDVRPACELVATRVFLDDDSDAGVYKYLRVIYECMPEVHDAAFRQRRTRRRLGRKVIENGGGNEEGEVYYSRGDESN